MSNDNKVLTALEDSRMAHTRPINDNWWHLMRLKKEKEEKRKHSLVISPDTPDTI